MFEVFGVVVIGLLMRILPAWLFLTAAHGHGALMGVYAMLAIALALFSLRNIVDARYWKEKWLMVSFWA